VFGFLGPDESGKKIGAMQVKETVTDGL